MVIWQLIFTKQALKDSKKIKTFGLKSKVEELLKILQKNPFQNPPRFEKLVGDLAGAYSRRINIQHRLVYQILTERKTVKIISMWTHYE
ncbi:MAG: Txe/YoeB family addiction module toxin [Candidatus Firestonebacteria bacterium]